MDIKMNINKLLSFMKRFNLTEYQFSQSFNGIEYTIVLVLQDNDISLPYILAIPNNISNNCLMALEVNNLELPPNLPQDEYKQQLLESGFNTGTNLSKSLCDFGVPLIIPILPGIENGIPYYQQLSKECLEGNVGKQNISDQIAKIVKRSKYRIESITNVEVQDKIFLNGYSSSGVFAERFCLLHPELIYIACIGGASGSIPIPTSDFCYPIGIADYENLTGEQFDFEEYKKIKFRYYVGELEESRKSGDRLNDFGDPAPMHDMSYMERSIPQNIGKQLREKFGEHIIPRAESEVKLLESLGIDITHYIIPGRTHNNNRYGQGVNELGEIFIKKIFDESNSFKNKML